MSIYLFIQRFLGHCVAGILGLLWSHFNWTAPSPTWPRPSQETKSADAHVPVHACLLPSGAGTPWEWRTREDNGHAAGTRLGVCTLFRAHWGGYTGVLQTSPGQLPAVSSAPASVWLGGGPLIFIIAPPGSERHAETRGRGAGQESSLSGRSRGTRGTAGHRDGLPTPDRPAGCLCLLSCMLLGERQLR